jgi:hypothetical protein
VVRQLPPDHHHVPHILRRDPAMGIEQAAAPPPPGGGWAAALHCRLHAPRLSSSRWLTPLLGAPRLAPGAGKRPSWSTGPLECRAPSASAECGPARLAPAAGSSASRAAGRSSRPKTSVPRASSAPGRVSRPGPRPRRNSGYAIDLAESSGRDVACAARGDEPRPSPEGGRRAARRWARATTVRIRGLHRGRRDRGPARGEDAHQGLTKTDA